MRVGDRGRWDGMYCTFDINRHNFEVVEGQKFGMSILLHLPDDLVRDRPEIPAMMEAGGSTRVAAGQDPQGRAQGSPYTYPTQPPSPTLHGPDPSAHAPESALLDGSTHGRDQPDYSRRGLVLMQDSWAWALQASRPLGGSTPLVSSLQAVAVRGISHLAGASPLR